MTARFAIVTDGTCTLPASFIAEHGIEVLPLHVTFGDEHFTEGVDITRERFYELLGRSTAMPGTSAPAPGECVAIFERAMRTHGPDVLVLTVAQELSATYNAAMTASRSVAGNVRVVDSRSVAGGTALVVAACARARARGRSFDEAVALAERVAREVRFYAYIHTLEYLRRSGRATALQAWFGSLLQIKPLVRVEEGRILPLDRARTAARGVARLKELVAAGVGEGGAARLCVLHANDPQGARDLVAWAERSFRCEELYCEEAGPALAARAGPGLLGVAFLTGSD